MFSNFHFRKQNHPNLAENSPDLSLPDNHRMFSIFIPYFTFKCQYPKSYEDVTFVLISFINFAQITSSEFFIVNDYKSVSQFVTYT